jgi:hypothetical protein
MPAPIFMKPDMYIMAPVPILHISLCLYVYPFPLLLGNNSSLNTFPQQQIYATSQQLLDSSSFKGPCLIKRKQAIPSSRNILFHFPLERQPTPLPHSFF